MIQWNRWIRPTPATMKIARMISAPRIPQNKTLCWCVGRHLEETENQQEDEQIVDAERELDHVSGNELQRRACARARSKSRPRKLAASAIHTSAPDQRFAKLHGVGATMEHAQVEHQHGQDEKVE